MPLFTTMRKRQFTPSPLLPGIARVTTLEIILGVAILEQEAKLSLG